MRELVNLAVELDDRFALSPEFVRILAASIPGAQIVPSAPADECTLAWIDGEFGGSWSSEAHVGTNALAFRDGMPVGFATFDPKGLRFAWLRGVARERDVGIFGPFGVAPAERKTGLARLLLRFALAGLRERGYARALIPAVGDERLIRYYADAVGAQVVERFDGAAWTAPRARVVAMASGSGSNFQAVLDRTADGTLPIDVVALVSNNAKAFALERARKAAVDAMVVPWNRSAQPRAEYDAQLLETVAALQPDLVLLLGWMHLLGEPFVRAVPDLLNLHPAFLPLDPERDDVTMPDGTTVPAFRGPHAVRDALLAGSTWVGATVHAVTPATDRGPVLARKPLGVLAGEDEAAVMDRLHPIEHELVAAAIKRWLYER